MTDELERAAREAIKAAAERLGVDPFRLARFLAHGRIADFLQALGRAETLGLEKRETHALETRFDAFLREEKRLAGKGPDNAKNGG